ncbi:ABC transporter [Candidatus Phytoplasma phoenicium]|uniref:ABC transporter n=1 Tax=Candidatus Phytoplasma phoenicium TaxID=198422 RepID=A0A2S8NUC1_9MOLU|nr:ABC transporter [Candidatus Phytoplasma phoenicium]
MPKYVVEIKNLNKVFNNIKVLDDINLKIKDKETLTIVGYSGSGKSTLLRCLNLLEKPESGQILINNKNILEPNVNLSALRIQVGMVFQNFNLFEEKNVLDNCILAPMKVLKIPKEIAVQNALEKLRHFKLEQFVEADVKKLSGGQKQRVAIIRALCMSPEIILLDEPTSALDPDSAQDVLSILKELALEKTTTLVIVTHEIKFAKQVSEEICFMENGKIIELGKVKDILETNSFPKLKSFFQI